VAGTFKDKTFGHESYVTPVRDHKFMHALAERSIPRISTSHTTYKDKLTCFTEDFAKLHKVNPGPHAKYAVDGANWLTTFQKHRGPFLRKKRTLFTEEHMENVKAKPGPNKYIK